MRERGVKFFTSVKPIVPTTSSPEPVAIRANSGHAQGDVQIDSLSRTRVTTDDATIMYHRTKYVHMLSICEEWGLEPGGLKRGSKRHEVFLSILDPDDQERLKQQASMQIDRSNVTGVIPWASPFESDLLIAVDVRLAIAMGCEFTQGTNMAILTRQRIPKECILWARDRQSKAQIWEQRQSQAASSSDARGDLRGGPQQQPSQEQIWRQIMFLKIYRLIPLSMMKVGLILRLRKPLLKLFLRFP